MDEESVDHQDLAGLVESAHHAPDESLREIHGVVVNCEKESGGKER